MARSKAIEYAVHPAVAHGQAVIAGLAEATGHALPQWLKLVAAQKLDERRAIMAWLKQAHGLGMSSAMLIAEAATEGAEALSAEGYLRAAPGYVEALFAGPKAALRPLYDELAELALRLGRDLKLSPTKTMVPLYREHVIAQLKPATRTRLDLGLALGATKAKGRLIDTGGYAKKDRITHRIGIEKAADIDAETKDWLKRAYELDAAK
jgi:hypothetical protein